MALDLENINIRLKAIEDWRHSRDIEYALIDKDLSSIKEDVAQIKNSVGWTIKLISGVIILAFVEFIIRGGLLAAVSG